MPFLRPVGGYPYEPPPDLLIWGPEGDYLARLGREPQIWDVKSGKPPENIIPHAGYAFAGTNHDIRKLALWRPDEARYRLLDIETGKIKTILEGSVEEVDFNVYGHTSDFSKLLLERLDKRSNEVDSYLWDTNSQSRLHSFDKGRHLIQFGSFDQDGDKLVVPSQNGDLHFYSAKTGEKLKSVETGIQGEVVIGWAGRNKVIANFSGKTEEYLIVDYQAGRIENRLSNIDSDSVSISPDGRYLTTTREVKVDENKQSGDERRRARIFGNFRPEPKRELVLWDLWNGKNTAVNGIENLVDNQPVWDPASKYFAIADKVDLRHGRTFLVSAEKGEVLSTIDGGFGGASMSFTTDSTRLTVAMSDGRIRTWNVTEKRFEHAQRPGHAEEILELDWSPCGRYLASVSYDSTVRVWDFGKQGREIAVLDVERAHAIAWCPDGENILIGGESNRISKWNPFIGEKSLFVELGHDSPRFVSDIAFDRQGTRIALALDFRPAEIWGYASKKRICFFDPSTIPQREEDNYSYAASFYPQFVDWASDGATVFATSRLGITYWEPANGHYLGHCDVDRKRIRVENKDDGAFSMSPDGVSIAISSEQGVVYGRLNDGNKTELISKPVAGVAYSPNGRYLAAYSGDEIVVWGIGKAEPELKLVGEITEITSVRWHPDGKTLVSGAKNGSIKVWQVDHSSESHFISPISDPRYGAAQPFAIGSGGYLFQPLNNFWQLDRKCEVLVGSFGEVYDPVSGVKIRELQRPVPVGTELSVKDFDVYGLDRNGQYFASVKAERRTYFNSEVVPDIVLWEVNSGRLLGSSTVERDESVVLNLVVPLEDGQSVAIGASDGSVTRHNVRDSQAVKTVTVHKGGISALTVSPTENWLASGSELGTVQITNLRDGSTIDLFSKMKASITCLEFDSTEEWLAFGYNDYDSDIARLKVFHIPSSDSFEVKDAPESGFSAVAFSSDGNYLISGGFDGSVTVWNRVTKSAIETHSTGSDEISTVRFSPDGRLYYACSWSGSFAGWKLGEQNRDILRFFVEDLSVFESREDKGHKLEWNEPYRNLFESDSTDLISNSTQSVLKDYLYRSVSEEDRQWTVYLRYLRSRSWKNAEFCYEKLLLSSYRRRDHFAVQDALPQLATQVAQQVMRNCDGGSVEIPEATKQLFEFGLRVAKNIGDSSVKSYLGRIGELSFNKVEALPLPGIEANEEEILDGEYSVESLEEQLPIRGGPFRQLVGDDEKFKVMHSKLGAEFFKLINASLIRDSEDFESILNRASSWGISIENISIAGAKTVIEANNSIETGRGYLRGRIRLGCFDAAISSGHPKGKEFFSELSRQIHALDPDHFISLICEGLVLEMNSKNAEAEAKYARALDKFSDEYTTKEIEVELKSIRQLLAQDPS